MKDEVSKCKECNDRLKGELSDMDYNLDSRERSLNEMQMTLEESHHKLESRERSLREMQRKLKEEQRIASETQGMLQQQQKERKRENEEFGIVLSQWKEKLKQVNIKYDTDIREVHGRLSWCEKENRALKEQLSDYKVKSKKLEERLSDQKHKYDTDTKKLRKEVSDYEVKTNDLRMEVSGCKRALEQSQKEKERMITEHKSLTKRFEESLNQLHQYCEEFKKMISDKKELEKYRQLASEYKQKIEQLGKLLK